MEKPSRSGRSRLYLRLAIRLLLTVGVLLLLMAVGPLILSLFAPFLASLVPVWILNPAIRFFRQRLGGSHRLWALLLLLILVVLLGGLLFGLFYYSFFELRALTQNRQAIWDRLSAGLEVLRRWRERLFPHLPPLLAHWLDRLSSWLLAEAQEALPALLSSLAAEAGKLAAKIPSFAVACVVFLLAGYFILADYPHLRALFISRMSPDTLGLLRFIRHTASAAFGGYVRAQFLLSLGVFFLLLGGFTLTGWEYTLLPALLLAMMDFIPIIGAGTILLPWAALCLFTGDSTTALQLFGIWTAVLLFRRIAEPRVVGKHTGLSPILSLISIYAGMKLGGIPGMIFGPMILLVAINLLQAGVWDNTLGDLRLALKDLQAILSNQR